jgi:hypothetical protein
MKFLILFPSIIFFQIIIFYKIKVFYVKITLKISLLLLL